jgi:hypothetical protein
MTGDYFNFEFSLELAECFWDSMITRCRRNVYF